MRNLLRKILPISLWNCLKKAKSYAQHLKVRLRIMFHMPLKNKHDSLGFRFHAVEHCNLNCCGCDNFSPLADQEFINVAELERDITRLSEIFEHHCEYIYISGGEPLMHPEIKNIMKIARDKFPDSDIYIFSNGILLSKQDDEFFKSCNENRTGIIVSAYPIKIDIEAIKARAEKFNVKIQWAWGQSQNERDTFTIKPVNLKGNSNIKLNFAMCRRANNCITLSHGRLFTCTFAPHVRHFNKYFSQNVHITEADYVNIYDDVTADEILTKMAEPIPACRYCDVVRPAKTVQWGISKREISEWV